MIDIKQKNGTVRLSVEITDKCVYHKTLMEEEYILLSFECNTLLPIEKGDYIETEFGTFNLFKPEKPSETTNGGFMYELKFHPEWEKFRNYLTFYNRQSGFEKAWKMTQRPEYFLDIICDNIYRATGCTYTYSVDANLTEMKLVEFDETNIIDGLTKLAEAWETEWWITENIIHLSKCEYGDPVRMGIDEELSAISSEDSSDITYATRIYVFGSSRNLPQNYRKSSDNLVIDGVVETRLKLPEGIDYIDAQENLSNDDIVEAVVYTDDIYPRNIGCISSVFTKEYTDTIENEDGTTTKEKWNAFRFTDTGLTFSKNYVLEGEELRIIFQSGNLAGMDFAITFNPDGLSETNNKCQVFEIVRNEDYGISLPTDDFKPEIGDTYILYGYDTSFVADNLVNKAENELLEFGKKQIKQLSKNKSNYTCETNPIRCAGYTANKDNEFEYNELDVIDLDVGCMVDLSHPIYFPNSSHLGRIRSFEKRLDNRYRCTYSVGDATNYSRISNIESEIKSITYKSKQYISSGSGSSIYLIKRKDTTIPTEHNAYSALRARIEFLCRSVAEYVRTRWTFVKGITIGSYVSGSDGASIEADGAIEVKTITSRGDATIGGDVNASGDVNGTNITAKKAITTEKVTTADFNDSSIAIGSGFGLTRDNNGISKLIIDDVVVRNKMTVASLVIQEYKSVGGVMVLSRAHGEIESIYSWSNGNGYDIYIKDFEKYPQFVKGDYMRCSRWDEATNRYVNYCVPVIAVVQNANNGKTCLNVFSAAFPDGVTPQVGDQLVQWGHNSDADRQGLIIISVENGTPRIDAYDGIKGELLPIDKLKARLGKLDGITDNGKALTGYGLWTNNLYIGNGKSIIDTFNDVTEQINNISTGGRNLIIGSQTVANDKSMLVGTYNLTNVNPPYQGETVTLSFSGYMGQGHGCFKIYNSGYSVFMANLTTANYNHATKRYEVTFKWKQVADDNQGSFINIFQYNEQGNRIDAGEFLNENRTASMVYNVLLERSPKASADWFPAPEDYNETLAQYKNEVSKQFDVIDGSLTSIQKSVRSLQIGGGRNLLLQTNQGTTGWKFWSASIEPYINTLNNGIIIENLNQAEASAVFMFQLRPECIISGRNYILSVDVTLGDMLGIDGQWLYLDIVKANGTNSLLSASIKANKSLILGQSVRISFPFTATTTGKTDGGQVIYLNLPASKWSSMSFENIKLEEGTVATNYSPAPEDYIDSELTNIRTSMTAIIQTTENITTRVEEVNTTLDSKISANTSKITQNADAIASEVTARVNGDNELSSRIDQTAKSISLSIREKGVANRNHAIGTETDKYKRDTWTGSTKLYDVTGFKTGDKITIQFDVEVHGITINEGGYIQMAFSKEYGYNSAGFRLYQGDLVYDENNKAHYRVDKHTIELKYQYQTTTEIVESDFAYVYLQTNNITATSDAYIKVSKLKVELGEDATAWTSRIDDLDTEIGNLENDILETGIDIRSRQIIAKADNFTVRNNAGQVTASVDADGNLTSNALKCRDVDNSTERECVTTINEHKNGWITMYYPNGKVQFEIGWDGSSMFRYFSVDGVLMWDVGTAAQFNVPTTNSETITVTPITLYECSATELRDAMAEIKTELSLPTFTLYKKTVQTNSATGHSLTSISYYTNQACTMPADGYYTDGGTPKLDLEENGSGSNSYYRNLYTISNGIITETNKVSF